MTSEADTRVWLVDRSYGNDEDLVTLVYATSDGERHLRKQFSSALLRRKSVTAGRKVPAAKLEPVQDPDTRDRYATEAERIATKFDPDDEI
jgi:hypothetical protein